MGLLNPRPDGAHLGALLDPVRMLSDGYPLHRRGTVRVGDLDVAIRPVVPTDALAIRDLIAGASERSRYLRFHAPVVRVTAAQLATIVDVDHHRQETLVASVGSRRGEHVVGFGQYLELSPDTVDLALLVRDDLQGHGIGRVLATRLIAAASDAGYTAATATILGENQRMLALARHLPMPTVTRPGGGVLEYRFDLTATPALAPEAIPA